MQSCASVSDFLSISLFGRDNATLTDVLHIGFLAKANLQTPCPWLGSPCQDINNKNSHMTRITASKNA